MTLAVYAEAELNCDGKDGEGCPHHAEEEHHTAYTLAAVKRELKASAKSDGWKFRNGNWLCPKCAATGG